MSPLEFDLQATSFAQGYGRALTEAIGQRVSVQLAVRDGHLYYAICAPQSAGADQQASIDGGAAWSEWREVVAPRLADLAERWNRAAAKGLDGMLQALRGMPAELEETTYLHHRLLVAARAHLAAHAERYHADTGDARPWAPYAGVRHVSRTLSAVGTLWALARLRRAGQIVDLTDDLVLRTAQEADGYGLRSSTWLSDTTPIQRLLDAYAAVPAASGSFGRFLAARRRGQLGDRPPAPYPVDDATNRALRLTEDHGLLFHVVVPDAARHLLLKAGEALRRAGMLGTAEDAFLLRHPELVQALADGYRGDVLRDRVDHRARLERRWPQFRTLPAALGERTAPAIPGRTGRRLQQQYAPPCGDLAGVSASPGASQGRARHVLRHADLARVAPGDVVVCGATPPWIAFALPLASALISEQGGLTGHGAVMARALACPAVLGVPEALDRIADGARVTIDADAGVVRVVS